MCYQGLHFLLYPQTVDPTNKFQCGIFLKTNVWCIVIHVAIIEIQICVITTFAIYLANKCWK